MDFSENIFSIILIATEKKMLAMALIEFHEHDLPQTKQISRKPTNK